MIDAVESEFPNLDELSMDASNEAYWWLSDAANLIDEHFGLGAAECHPIIVAAFMVSAALAYNAGRVVAAADAVAAAIRDQNRGAHER